MFNALRRFLVSAASLLVLASPGDAQLVLEPEFEPSGMEQGLLPLLTEQLRSWETTPAYTTARVFRFGEDRFVVLGNGASDRYTPMPGRTPWSIQLIGLEVPEHSPYLLGMTVGEERIDSLLIEDFDSDGDLDLFVCLPVFGQEFVHTASFDGREWVKLDQTTVDTPGCRVEDLDAPGEWPPRDSRGDHPRA